MAVKANVEHPEYSDMKMEWQKVRDCFEGSKRVKSRRDLYLPMPNPTDTSAKNIAKYGSYLLRAVFLNVVAPTVNSMVGSIFRRKPQVNLPQELDYLIDDAVGAGVPLIEFAKQISQELDITGRYGILVDQLSVEFDNKAQEDAAGILPRLTGYPAEAITQWHEEVIDGIRQPTLIILQEVQLTPLEDNPFEFESHVVQRVLRLDHGIYTQTMWDKDKPIPFDDGEMLKIPTMTGEQPFTKIPFVFVGITSNTACVDQPPLLPLADLNIAHYRNSADFEESVFITGQPTLKMIGLPQSWVDKNLANGVLMGAGQSLPLPVGADADLIEASPNQLAATAMEKKEEQMLKVGLRATDGTSGRETATAASMRWSADEAVMGKLSSNTSAALETALGYTYQFVTGKEPPKITYKLNMHFYPKLVDPQLLLSLIASYEQGLFTFEEIRENLLEMGLVVDEESDIQQLKAFYQKYVLDLKLKDQSASTSTKGTVDNEKDDVTTTSVK